MGDNSIIAVTPRMLNHASTQSKQSAQESMNALSTLQTLLNSYTAFQVNAIGEAIATFNQHFGSMYGPVLGRREEIAELLKVTSAKAMQTDAMIKIRIEDVSYDLQNIPAGFDLGGMQYDLYDQQAKPHPGIISEIESWF